MIESIVVMLPKQSYHFAGLRSAGGMHIHAYLFSWRLTAEMICVMSRLMYTIVKLSICLTSCRSRNRILSTHNQHRHKPINNILNTVLIILMRPSVDCVNTPRAPGYVHRDYFICLLMCFDEYIRIRCVSLVSSQSRTVYFRVFGPIFRGEILDGWPFNTLRKDCSPVAIRCRLIFSHSAGTRCGCR